MDVTRYTNKTERYGDTDIISDDYNGDCEKPILHTTVLQIKTVNAPDEERLDKLLELIDLNHLDTKERNNVIALIKNYQERFHLPVEQLSETRVLRHRIPTVDDYHINTKQYRFLKYIRPRLIGKFKSYSILVLFGDHNHHITLIFGLC